MKQQNKTMQHHDGDIWSNFGFGSFVYSVLKAHDLLHKDLPHKPNLGTIIT